MSSRHLPASIVDRDVIERSSLPHVAYAKILNGKTDFKLERLIFDSGKSLEIHKKFRKIPEKYQKNI